VAHFQFFFVFGSPNFILLILLIYWYFYFYHNLGLSKICPVIPV
jgi:hypothetical protein